MTHFTRMIALSLAAGCAAFGACIPAAMAADAAQAVLTDSRIKTFVYNENDVYSILTHFGYQTNIEFGPGEEVDTVSVGDRIGWQIIPAGSRLFIRAMEENARTNMTVVTSKRAYQFDLKASATDGKKQEELVYVARFYYPSEEPLLQNTIIQSEDIARASGAGKYNFNYTFTGSESLAPARIFDDGKSTFFKFRSPESAPPAIFAVSPDGKEIPVSTKMVGGYVVVPATGKRFSVRLGSELVCVFNEAP